MEARVLEGCRIVRRNFKTDTEGRRRLAGLLRKSDAAAMEFLKKGRNQAENRLHSFYAGEGMPDVTKGDLADRERRESRRMELSPLFQEQAKILEARLELFEKRHAELEEKMRRPGTMNLRHTL
jgi:hypothetical protein